MTPEVLRPAVRAQARIGDRADTGRQQFAPGQRPEVAQPMLRARRGPECRLAPGKATQEGLPHLGTDLEDLRPDPGAKPGLQAGIGPAFAHCRHQGADDSARQAPPPRVSGTDDGAIGARHQHRQAIGDQHCQPDVGTGREGAIGTGRLPGAINRPSISIDDPDAVDLAQPQDRSTEGRRHARPVLGHGPWIIPATDPQIQAATAIRGRPPGGTDPAIAGRDPGADAGYR